MNNDKQESKYTPFGTTFGKRLKDLREAKGLRQSDLAKICDVAVASYANWEQGRALPPLSKIPLLADLFEVSSDYMLGISKQEAADRLANRMRNLSPQRQKIVQAIIDDMMENRG